MDFAAGGGTVVAGPDGVNRQLVVAHDLGELWLALLEAARVVALRIVPEAGPGCLGAIARGRVTRLAPGLGGVFVDVGLARDGLLVPDRDEAALPPLAVGDQPIVQVVREPEAGKGVRLTGAPKLAGELLVLLPGRRHVAVGRGIEVPAERERLRRELAALAPAGCGLIARTAAADAPAERLRSEGEALAARWQRIEQRAGEGQAPRWLEPPPDPLAQFLVEQTTPETVPDQLIVEPAARALLAPEIAAPAPVTMHDGPLPAVEAFGLERALAAALATEVPLPDGGRLLVEPTAALIAIDVDGPPDADWLAVDLAAARELARQLRLRELAGVIVVDFVTLRAPADRQHLAETLTAALAADPARPRLAGLAVDAVARIVRRRRRPALASGLLEPCPCCGRGTVPNPSFAARQLLRRLRRTARGAGHDRYTLAAPPAVLAEARRLAARDAALAALRMRWAEGPERVARGG